MGSEAIAVESLSKGFGSINALTDVDLTVDDGEFCVVIGPSGCGKSVLLECIAGLMTFDDGSLRLRGEQADDVPVEERDLGYIFQEFEEALFPHKTVAKNIAFGLEQSDTEYTEGEIEQRIDEMLELLSITDTKNNVPSELSGGQQQRVELARHLVRENDIMLLDDPLADLDYKLQKRMELEIRHLHNRLESCFLYVTHNQDQALKLADKIVVMNRGRIEQVGTADEVYADPKTAFVGRFVGDSNPFRATLVDDDAPLTVDTAIGEIAATPANNDTLPAESIVLIRPEDIEIGTSAAGCDNTVTGTVSGRSYTGEITEISVSVGGFDRDIQVIEPDRPDIGQHGETVEVGWDAVDATYFETLSIDSTVDVDTLMEI